MEFTRYQDNFLANRENGHFYLLSLHLSGIEIYDNKKMEYITDSLNPTHLEIISEKECPNCDGFGNKDGEVCHNCKPSGDGVKTKIEVVTQFTVFGSKEKYDEAVIARGRYEGSS